MNFTLFKAIFKKNYVLAVIFLYVMLFYSVVMLIMYRPDSIASLNAMFDLLPSSMMSALGISGLFTNVIGYLASWLYGTILVGFPMVYCIILGNRLIAKTVDSGSMACLLSTPHSRTKIIVTKGIYAFSSILVMHLTVFLVSFIVIKTIFPLENFDSFIFFKLNLTIMLVNITVMAITFFFSALFNDSKYALSFGTGIPLTFLILNMLGNASPDAAILKKFSMFGWYNTMGIANGDSTLFINLVFIFLTSVLFLASIFIFKRKQLPL